MTLSNALSYYSFPSKTLFPGAFITKKCLVLVLLIWLLSPLARAQAAGENQVGSQQRAEEAAIENGGAAVELDGRPVLMIYTPLGGFSPQERADAIQKRLLALGRRRSIPLEVLHTQDHGVWTEILAGDTRIMGITESDAKAAGRQRLELAAEYTEIIRHVLRQYRAQHTWRRFVWGMIYTVLATASLVLALMFLFWSRRRLRSKLMKRLEQEERAAPIQSRAHRLRRYLGRPLFAFGHVAFWCVALAFVQAYLTVVLRFFASTRYMSYQITNSIFSALASFGKVVVGYLPNLVLIAFICFATYYLIKVNEYVFGELRDGRLTIHGFYPDWAGPTAKLVRVLILAAAAVVVFPYLPGSASPAFKGISVFLGVLLSLGSTSAVAHAVAGTILTYMRAFQVGDFVRIGSDVGEVVEKTLLVTRVCTQKKEVITIPNGTVLGGVVINYSAGARQRGVIFHTVVTIGYNAPWRQVHELLLSAALATEGILHDPPPFVLQTALNDFYVAYELNAYTATPMRMQWVYSVLHQNIQDKFNEAGVEINSPHYTALRDGNRTTIPDSYLPNDYKSPVFEIQETDGSQLTREKVKQL